MPDTIEKDVFEILEKYAKQKNETITPDTPLQGVGVDSLLMVEIIFELEEKYDISIPDDIIGDPKKQVKTAADVVRTVRELIEQQGQ